MRAGGDPSARRRDRTRRLRPRGGRAPRRTRRGRARAGRCRRTRGARSRARGSRRGCPRSPARSRAFSAKQVSPKLHFPAPGHSRGAQLAARRDGVRDVDVGEVSGHRLLARTPRVVRGRARASVRVVRRASPARRAQTRSFARHTYCERPLRSAAENSTPPCSRRWGRSLCQSWSCSVSVAVDTTTFLPDTTAGTRYARPLPEPGRRLGDEVVPGAHRVGHGMHEPELTRSLVATEGR